MLALRVFSLAAGIFRFLLPPLKPSSPQSLRIWPAPDVTRQLPHLGLELEPPPRPPQWESQMAIFLYLPTNPTQSDETDWVLSTTASCITASFHVAFPHWLCNIAFMCCPCCCKKQWHCQNFQNNMILSVSRTSTPPFKIGWHTEQNGPVSSAQHCHCPLSTHRWCHIMNTGWPSSLIFNSILKTRRWWSEINLTT